MTGDTPDVNRPDADVADSDPELARILGEIQRRGAIGTTAIADAVAHAMEYVDLIPPAATIGVDLGSGGGLPGLILARRLPSIQWVLVDRRGKRADLLRFAVRALSLSDNTRVVDADLTSWHELDGAVEVVTARRFGPLRSTLMIGGRLLRPTGSVVVSVADAQETNTHEVVELGFRADERRDGVVRFVRCST
jgi:16S rRNA (guanine527-N7)-methyltransferase